MYKFSKTSKARLDSCSTKIQNIFNEVIKYMDVTVVSGHRTPAEQLELYKKGRSVNGNIVTNIDGYTKKSKHNYSPSLAVDVVPYPIDWEDEQRFLELSVIVKRIAAEQGTDVVWGGDWKSFKDYPHWQE